MTKIDEMLDPEKYGKTTCPHCNGYGSSLKEQEAKCTFCFGTGLVGKDDAKRYESARRDREEIP
jgi:DnaJ-class molecular chaperone